ncbi:hypothetical protein Pogu_1095 [Pyrobaculum oguniense TE7]|uniref:Uncharacterized protein n=1 Tax=Pyrobaculum oguniense (strain DSM 13380 / JCM 10595 / TE7) TaxID=698757 RepID=H6Q8P0_PYROT|nr:hypothetical protein Pogu_1095 [Pyrobaculum oguniense TE7]
MYSAPAGRPPSFLSALTKPVLRSRAFKAYLALAPVVVALCLMPRILLSRLGDLAGPLAYIYVHEVAQYLALGVDISLRLEGGYIVLEPLGRPRRPRAALIACALAPAALVAPLFSAVISISVVLTLARYVGG